MNPANVKPAKDNNPAKFSKSFKILLALIIGVVVLFALISVCIVFWPVTKPEIVKRIEAEQANKGSVKAGHNVTTLTLPGGLPLTLPPVAQSLPGIIETSAIEWNQKLASLRPRMAAYDREAPWLTYKESNQRLKEMFMDLKIVAYHIVSLANKLRDAKLISEADWVKFVDAEIAHLNKIWKEMAPRQLENYLRHEHWSAAATFCSFMGPDYRDQNHYYFHRLGGVTGYAWSAFYRVGVPLQNVKRKMGNPFWIPAPGNWLESIPLSDPDTTWWPVPFPAHMIPGSDNAIVTEVSS